MKNARQLSVQETQSFLKDHPGGVLVDVLTPEFHVQQHIPGAVGACVFETAFEDYVHKLAPDKETPVLVYGAGNSRDSEMALEKLRRDGYRSLFVFSDGLEAWKKASLPLEGTDTAHAPEEVPVMPLFASYALLPEKSVIRWVGRNASHNHYGTLRLQEGELSFPNGGDKPGSGALSADMRSIDCTDLAGSSMLPVLLRHLASVDFFDVARFPEASLRIMDLSPLPEGNVTRNTHRLLGMLRLLQTEREVECDVALRNLPDKGLGMYCQYTLDRTQWGVIYGSAAFFRFLGMHSVDDNISLDGDVFFQARTA